MYKTINTAGVERHKSHF